MNKKATYILVSRRLIHKATTCYSYYATFPFNLLTVDIQFAF